MAAGYIGMRIAVLSNSRTAQTAMISKHAALRVAFNGGAVMGLLVVGLALLAVGLYYKLGEAVLRNQEQVVSSLVGLALGASLMFLPGWEEAFIPRPQMLVQIWSARLKPICKKMILASPRRSRITWVIT
jgi:hypothetical protein